MKGSVTGEDGTGTSEKTFISNSGKIIIDSTQWFRAREFARFPWVMPGDVLKWKVTGMCKDEVISAASYATTIVLGIENGQHRLKLSGNGLKHLRAIGVYEPALK